MAEAIEEREEITLSRKLLVDKNGDTQWIRWIKEVLKKSNGAIFLKKLGTRPYNPELEGLRLFRVLSALFPKETLEVLTRLLNEARPAEKTAEEVSAPVPSKIPGKILGI